MSLDGGGLSNDPCFLNFLGCFAVILINSVRVQWFFFNFELDIIIMG